MSGCERVLRRAEDPHGPWVAEFGLGGTTAFGVMIGGGETSLLLLRGASCHAPALL